MKLKTVKINIPEKFKPYLMVSINDKQISINHFDGNQTMDMGVQIVAATIQYLIEKCCDLNEYNSTQKEQLEAHFMEALEHVYASMKSEWKHIDNLGGDEKDEGDSGESK